MRWWFVTLIMEYIYTNLGVFPKLGFGTYSVPKDKLQELILEALRIGYTLFDTANKYKNEELIGRVLHDTGYNRMNYLLETKVHAALLLGNLRYLRLNRKSPRSALHRACRNLRTDYIDVFMIHGFFKGYENFLRRYIALKELGLIKYIGLCNVNLHQLESLYAMRLLPDIVQVEIHPYHSNKPLIEFCHLHNIVVEARSPFAHGDAIVDWMKEPILQNIANVHKATIPQVILRWITQQEIVALPRTSNIHHLKENIQSFKITLSEEEICAIDSLNKDKSYGYISFREFVKQ